jgi:hypothetical protein
VKKSTLDVSRGGFISFLQEEEEEEEEGEKGLFCL